MVVQRDRLVAGRAEQCAHLLRRVRTDRPGPRQHAHPGGSLPQPPQLILLGVRKREGVDEQLKGRPAEHPAGQRAGGHVLQLAGQQVAVAMSPRVLPEIPGEHLRHGELVDLAWPGALGVLLPGAPPSTGPQEEFMQVLRGGLPGKVIGGGVRGIESVVSHRRLSAVQGGQCDISATFSRYRMGRWSHRGGGITRWRLARPLRAPRCLSAQAAVGVMGPQLIPCAHLGGGRLGASGELEAARG